MKRIFTFFWVAAAAVMSLVSCNQKELAPELKAGEVQFTFEAGAPATKTAIVDMGGGEYQPIWTEGDRLGVYLAGEGKEIVGGMVMDCTPSADGLTATFTGSKSVADNESQLCYGCYPAEAAVSEDLDNALIGLAVNCEQTIYSTADKDTYCMERFSDLLVAKPFTCKIADGKGSANGHIQFARVSTPIRVNLNCAADAAFKGEKVKEITISTPGVNIAGIVYVDMTTAEVKEITERGNGSASDLLHLVPSSLIGLQVGGETSSVFASAAPVTIPAGTEMTITVVGETNTFKKVITTSEMNLPAGNVAVFNLNLTAADIEGGDTTEDKDVKWDLTKDETSSASKDALKWEEDGVVSMSFSKGTSTDANNYYPGTSGQSYTHTRVYTGAKITVTPAEGVEIKSIDFVATGATQLGTLEGNVGWENGTKERDDEHYTIVVTPTNGKKAVVGSVSGACRLASVTVHCTVTGTPTVVTKYNVTCLSVEGGVVSADCSKAEEGATVTLTATPDAGYQLVEWDVKNASTNASITVTDNKFTMPAADVTVSAKFGKRSEVEATIADAIAGDPNTVYILTGKVKNIKNTTYGNFDLVDATGSVYIYGLLNAAGEAKKFAELGIEEDDTVVLKGQIIDYVGSDGSVTKEIQNAQYVSHTKAVKVPSKLNWTGYTAKYYVGDTFKIDGTISVDWEDGTSKSLTASDVTLVTAPDLSKTGTTSAVIKYECEGGSVTATASITVEAASEGGKTVTVTVNIASYAEANSWKTSAGTDVYPYLTVNMDENVSISVSEGGNNGSFWGTDWRLYQNQNPAPTITAANGCELQSVTFKYTISNGGTLLFGGTAVASGKQQTLSGSSATFTVGNTGTKTNGQVRISEITVTYTK